LEAPWSRDNHLGNGMGGFANTYNWTLPTREVEPCIEGDNCNCVFRMRYNMSTEDYPGHAPGEFVDSRQNGLNSPIKQDPYVPVEDITLSLALNTDQYGRAFEDRSHVFHIRPRPDDMSSSVPIYNINVRGKRGNIVQVYPAVEYDFVPVDLTVVAGDYVHFQWTGCDTNPSGNAGEGTDKTDRSNCVQMLDLNKNYPFNDWANEDLDMAPLFEEPEIRKHMAYLGQTNCLSLESLKAKTGGDQNQIEQDKQNCMKLNAAPAYFDAGLMRMNHSQAGYTYHYMSTRNNNYTNRSQKGALTVETILPVWGIVLIAVGSFLVVAGAAVGGAFIFAKTHPHSKIASVLAGVKKV